MKLRRPPDVLVLLAYTAAATLLSFPLALRFTDSIPGIQGDVWSYFWAMGWARVSMLDLGVNPFRSDYVFYPLGGATQLLWGTALPTFASLPLQLAFGLVPAFNLLYLAATVFTAYGTYLLVEYVLASTRPPNAVDERSSPPRPAIWPGAFVAGLAFAFCALRLGYGLAFTNLFHTELVPFYILFLLKSPSSLKNAVLAGIVLGLNAYIDFQIAAFLVLFTALWLGFSSLGWIYRSARTGDVGSSAFSASGRVISRAAVIGAIAAFVAVPMIAFVAQDFTAEGGNYIRVYPLKYSVPRSYDVLSYLLPNARSTLYEWLPSPKVAGINAALNVEGESHLSPDRQVFVGLTVLALAVIGAISLRRGLGLWVAAATAFSIISLGPTLHLAGLDVGVPLPYAALHDVPFLNNIRIPMRYGIMSLLSIAVLAGAGMMAVAGRSSFGQVRLLGLTGAIAVLILAESAVLPYPTLGFSVPHIYDEIAKQPGDFSVLEIPSFNWRSAAQTEVFQVVHHKRLLRVYTNRIAPDLADYFGLRQTPIVARSLRVLEGIEDGALLPEELSQDRANADETIRFFNLRYAVLHKDLMDEALVVQVDIYLKSLGAKKLADEGGVSSYQFPLPVQAPLTRMLDLASNDTLLYLGRGWQTEPLAAVDDDRGRLMSGPVSELYFDSQARQLTVRAYSEKSGAVLQFERNSGLRTTVLLKQGWADYELTAPAGFDSPEINTWHLVNPDPTNRIALATIELR